SVRGMSVALNLRHAQVRVSLTETRGSGGQLGGYVLRTELQESIARIYPEYAALAQSLINRMVDVATGTPATCDMPDGAVSMGVGVDMVRARIAATPVTGRQPGMCGTSPGA